MKHRVVITGIGLVTPLGCSTSATWDGMKEGRSGVDVITRFDVTGLPVNIAGEVKGFDPTVFMGKKEARQFELFLQYALAAAQIAVGDAGLDRAGWPADLSRAGVFIGSARGGLPSTDEASITVSRKGRLSPQFILTSTVNLASTVVACRYGIRGPVFGFSAACATGAIALGEAFGRIRSGLADVMLAGASDAALCPVAVAGYSAARVLSRRGGAPQAASRPFDRDRDGFVMAEGAGVLVLENMERAMARGATIYAEVAGYGLSCDAWSMAHPHPEGDGAVAAMEGALIDGGVTPETVGYINAHGTGTLQGDRIETLAIRRVFGEHADRLVVSSSKSMLGHMLGAAGAVEAAVTAITLKESIITPTINLLTPDPDCNLDYAPGAMRIKEIDVAITNSFGFGGTNASLLLQRVSL